MMIEDTAGFYKIDGDELVYGRTIFGPTYTLIIEDHKNYTYPTSDGWFWFDSEREAKDYFGIPYELEDGMDQSEVKSSGTLT